MNITGHREFMANKLKCSMCGRPVGFDYYYVVKTETKATTLCDFCVEKHPAGRLAEEVIEVN